MADATTREALLLGASGGMGRRVAALWRRNVPNVPLRLGVRRPETLRNLPGGCDEPIVAVRLEDPDSIYAAVERAAVVLNAIGPYIYDPVPLLEACRMAGAPYLDLASEPEFCRTVRAWGARPDLSIAVCPGASTIPGLVEVTAAFLAERLDHAPSAYDVFLSVGTANRLTEGLFVSKTFDLGRPLASPVDGLAYRRLRTVALPRLGRRVFGRYPAPFDAEGLPAGGRCVPARFWAGTDRAWIAQVVRVLSYVRPYFGDLAWAGIARKLRPLVGLASKVGGEPGGLRVEALGPAGEVLGAVDFYAERNGLDVPALPAVWAGKALIEEAPSGYCPLPNLVSFAQAVASLRDHGFEVTLNLKGRQEVAALPVKEAM